MQKINVYDFNDNIRVYYTGRRVTLPDDYICLVEKHWESLLQSGKKFFRGESFTITDIENCGGYINIFVELTDYAHFLYTMHKEVHTPYDCRVIYTSVLVETSDGEFVLGEMNRDTAFPQKLQLTGGGIDKDDIDGSIIDLKHNIKKEIYEELGIDTDNKDLVKEFKPYLLKSGGSMNFLSAIYKLDLLINQNELLDRFNKYIHELTFKGENSEFKNLMFIKADRESVEEFIKIDSRQRDENLVPTLEAALGIYKVRNISDFDNRF